MNVLAENIMRQRKEKGMTQRELAEKLNVSDKTVSRWETGKQVPDALIVPELAMAFGVSIDELYGMNGAGTDREEDTPVHIALEYGKITIFKVALIIVSVIYLFMNLLALVQLGEIMLGILFAGQVLVLFVIGMIFREFYKRKPNAEHYESEHLKWMGLAVLATDFVIAVWVPLIKHIRYNREYPLLAVVFVGVLNIVLLLASIRYRKTDIQRKELWLPILAGIIGVIVVIGNILYYRSPLQISPSLYGRGVWDQQMRLYEVIAGILFLGMQVVNYVQLLGVWEGKRILKRFAWSSMVVSAVTCIVATGCIMQSYRCGSLYRLLAQRVYEEDLQVAMITTMNVGVNFGVGSDTFNYFTLTEDQNTQEVLKILKRIKVEEGVEKVEEETGRSCRIRFESFFQEKDQESVSWDVTLMESGEVWYRGEKYCITNLDDVNWNQLFRVAIREYTGVNQEFYEELLDATQSK